MIKVNVASGGKAHVSQSEAERNTAPSLRCPVEHACPESGPGQTSKGPSWKVLLQKDGLYTQKTIKEVKDGEANKLFHSKEPEKT